MKGGILVETIPLGESKVMWRTPEPGRPDVVRNEVSLGYETMDGDLRRITLRFSSADSAAMNDTLYIRTGKPRTGPPSCRCRQQQSLDVPDGRFHVPHRTRLSPL